MCLGGVDALGLGFPLLQMEMAKGVHLDYQLYGILNHRGEEPLGVSVKGGSELG